MKHIAIIIVGEQDYGRYSTVLGDILKLTVNKSLLFVTNVTAFDSYLLSNNLNVSSTFYNIYNNSEYVFKNTECVIFITQEENIKGYQAYKKAKELNLPIRIIKV